MASYVLRVTIRRLPGIVIRVVPLPEPSVTKGQGARAGLGRLCAGAGFSRVLLVTDRTLFGLGYHEKAVSSLEAAGVGVTVFSDVAGEPTEAIIEAGRRAALSCGAECVVALGGGSVMDACKMIAAGARLRRLPVRALLGKFLLVPGGTLPLITIPSTAGTGAETTVGAIVTREKRAAKGATVVVGLKVPHVILDSELTLHAPRSVTAACGIDALSHGMEGAVADVKAAPEDEVKSRACVKTVLDTLGGLLEHPDDPDARLRMAEAAFFGGNAINKQLAGYVHAFAHSIGARYHIPHGEAIALCLLPVMRFQKDACLDKMDALAAYCGLAEDGDAPGMASDRLLDAVGALIDKCAFPDRGAFIPRGDHPALVRLITNDSINYSAPLTMRRRDIVSLLCEIGGNTRKGKGNDMAWNKDTVHAAVEAQRAYFRKGETLDVAWRVRQLKKLKQAVIDHEADFLRALHEDLGRSPVEAYLCDVGPIITEINETLAGIRKWAKPEKHFSGLMCFPSTETTVYKMPYGVSLIISPFNFPLLLTLGVLTASLAGGNTAVIKASSKSAACTALLKSFIAEVFPPEYVTVIDGGHDVADLCLAERFDKIFYTGSPAVGKHVLSEAAKNLTSTALELGGETGNWCLVRADADLRDAARKIAFFKLCNAGQICININQIAVAEEVADEFLSYLKAEFDRQIGKDPLKNPDYPRLITDAAYNKCAALADGYRDRIVHGGTGDPASRRYAPTIICPVGEDEDIVRRELFCPLLPVVPFKDAEAGHVLDVMADREHPLALYVFTKDIKWARSVMSSQQYGGGCINEVCIHMMVKGVPFGGVGHSGMGAYHGEWGFREFTHPSTVLTGRTHFNLPLREHPYSGRQAPIKMELLHLFEK